MADNEPTQIPSQSLPPPEGIENIWSVVFTGVTVQMASHILDQLVIALAISTVNDCTTRGVLSYTAVRDTLLSAGSKCSKRARIFEFNDREKSVMDILDEISFCDRLPIDANNDTRLDSIKRIIDRHTVNALAERDRGRKNFRVWGLIDTRWKFRESALFTEAVNSVQRLSELQTGMKREQLRYEMQRLKVGAVHEICVSMGVGWALFQNVEDCGYLFCDKSENDHSLWTTEDKFTAYNLIEYLSNSRHFTAHYRTLSDGPGDIGTFMNQFTSMEELLNQYFQKVTDQMPCHVRRTYIRYLFPGIVDSQKELGRKLGNCYSDLKAIMDNRSELAEDKENLTKRVCSLKEEKQQMDLKIWSVITQYYLNRHQPTVADDPIYKELLLLIQNHENITSLPAQDGQPLVDLQTLHEPKNTTVEAAATPTEVTSRQTEQRSENELTDVDHADQPTDYVGENKTTKSKRKRRRNKKNK